MLGDTIVAAASAPGRSPRAVIRLSGAATREVLASVLAGPARPFDRGVFASSLQTPTAERGNTSLPVLVAVFRGPSSYTGEDSAEILLPGNPYLVERVLGLLGAIPGVRPATPGEFTARAYLNDRMTLDQAEGVAATIAAQSAAQLTAARSLLAGRTGAAYLAWAEELATLLALVEAGIDFSDQEDVVAVSPAALATRLSALKSAIGAFLGGDGSREASGELPRVVLAGPPNAGKSTLFNALLGRRRAAVSPVAGTTRDVLEETLDLARDAPGTAPVMLADLAGVEEATAANLDAAAQARARGALAAADVVVQCDPSGRFPPLTTPPRGGIIRVRTKGDLPVASHGKVPPDAGIAVCALDGWNLGTLRRAIADAAWGARTSGLAAILPRHRRALSETGVQLREALATFSPQARTLSDPALTASALRSALDSLGELVGRISPDDVIGRVFATFCIGK